MAEQKILDAINAMHQDINSRFDLIETKLSKTNRKTQSNTARIENLEKIVAELTADNSIRLKDSPLCLDKNGVYKLLNKSGYDVQDVIRKLAQAEFIRRDRENRNTCVQKVNGKPQRVIIVRI